MEMVAPHYVCYSNPSFALTLLQTIQILQVVPHAYYIVSIAMEISMIVFSVKHIISIIQVVLILHVIQIVLHFLAVYLVLFNIAFSVEMAIS